MDFNTAITTFNYSSQQEDFFLNYLVSMELKNNQKSNGDSAASAIRYNHNASNSIIGISQQNGNCVNSSGDMGFKQLLIKSDPDANLSALFENPMILDQYRSNAVSENYCIRKFNFKLKKTRIKLPNVFIIKCTLFLIFL